MNDNPGEKKIKSKKALNLFENYMQNVISQSKAKEVNVCESELKIVKEETIELEPIENKDKNIEETGKKSNPFSLTHMIADFSAQNKNSEGSNICN